MSPLMVAENPVTSRNAEDSLPVTYSNLAPVIGSSPSNCFIQLKEMEVLVVPVTMNMVAGSGEAERYEEEEARKHICQECSDGVNRQSLKNKYGRFTSKSYDN